jgi:SAM-dependent methyltransferase
MQSRDRDVNIRSASQLRQAYNSAYGERELSQLVSYYSWIFSLLPISEVDRFLDVACGEGYLVAIARQYDLLAYGIDISDRVVGSTSSNLEENDVFVADGERLPFSNESFDLVTNLGSLEHYLHPEYGISEIARVLHRDGVACVVLPNSYSLLENVWTVMRTGDVGDQNQPVERYATRAEWTRLLSRNGLNVYKTYSYNLAIPRNRADWIWYFKHPRKLLWLAASLFVPHNLSSCFLFLCYKRPSG